MPGHQVQVGSNLGDYDEAVAGFSWPAAATAGSVRAVITQALHRVAPEADLELATGRDGLQTVLDLDSMDFLNFVMALEELTGLTIPERDYPRLASLEGCLDYLEKGTR